MVAEISLETGINAKCQTSWGERCLQAWAKYVFLIAQTRAHTQMQNMDGEDEGCIAEDADYIQLGSSPSPI